MAIAPVQHSVAGQSMVNTQQCWALPWLCPACKLMTASRAWMQLWKAAAQCAAQSQGACRHLHCLPGCSKRSLGRGLQQAVYQKGAKVTAGLAQAALLRSTASSSFMAAYKAQLLTVGQVHSFCGLKTPHTKLEAAKHLACLQLETSQLLVHHKIMLSAAKGCLQMSGGREGCLNSLNRWAQRGRSCVWATKQS